VIAYLRGTVLRMPQEKPIIVLLTAAGVGYEITLPAFVLQSLLQEGVKDGHELGLDVYYHVTERVPKPMLVGFRNAWEKRFFEQLIHVEGVGPSTAAAALIFPPADVARAIENRDLSLLRRMPGIGERAAQKIIATLEGKVTEWALTEAAPESPAAAASPAEESVRDEAIEALMSLGHRAANARDSVDEVLSRRPELAENAEALIREVFRSLASAAQ